jgi:hypothetical protein
MTTLLRCSPGTYYISEDGVGTWVVARKPRKRDFLKVLFGRYQPVIDISVFGVGQYRSPDAPFPASPFRRPDGPEMI